MNGKIHGLSGAAPVVVKHFDSVRNFRVEFMLISQDNFGFLQAFWCTGAQKHDVNFLLMQRFQPMTAQLNNVDCRAVVLLVERYVEVAMKFCCAPVCQKETKCS